jgi:hypothetical protein
LPPSMTRQTGRSAAPTKKTPSYPAFFNSGPQVPPAFESAQPPVIGDLVVTVNLPPPYTPVAVRGPVVKHNMLSGPSGSIPGFVRAISTSAPSPVPPMQLR